MTGSARSSLMNKVLPLTALIIGTSVLGAEIDPALLRAGSVIADE